MLGGKAQRQNEPKKSYLLPDASGSIQSLGQGESRTTVVKTQVAGRKQKLSLPFPASVC
jgi:hypothetical protein